MSCGFVVCTVKTASGARAVQIVHSSRRGSRDIEHIGSAHDDAALEALKAVARQRPASTSSPPSTRYPTTSAMLSPASTTAVHTNLSQVRLPMRERITGH